MQTELYSLSKIFTENIFRIPDYQRGYSWGQRQLKDFWADLVQLEEGKDHYTGVLTLELVPKETTDQWLDDSWIITSKCYTPYYVVDGQQRLTTSIILLQCILEKAGTTELNYTSPDDIRRKFIFESKDKGISRSYIFGYERDNPSYEHLKKEIFLERSDLHSAGETTAYTQNLTSAKAFFSTKLAPLTDKQTEGIFTRLTQHFLFNIYTIAGEIDVFVAFETMNNRGKALSHLELLKNRLIFLSTRLPIDDTERAKLRRVVNESWKTVYHFLGKNKQRPIEDDHFLGIQYLIYRTERKLKAGDYLDPRELWRFRRAEHQDFFLEEYFTPRNLMHGPIDALQTDGPPSFHLTADVLFEYAHHIKSTVEHFYRIINPSDSRFSTEARILLERIRRIGWSDALPLAVVAVSRGISNSALLSLLERLERHLFLGIIRQRRPDERMDLLKRSIDVVSGETTIDAVSSQLHDINAELAKGIEASAFGAGWGKASGYYGWRGLKYFLFEYEQELKNKSKSDRDKLTWEEFISESFETDYDTVEHIFPQSARDKYWSQRFDSFSKPQKEALRNSLGNLLALSRPKNASLSNKPFPSKRDGDGSHPGYRMGSYSEIEVAENADWTPQAILERGLKLLSFLEQRWSLRIGDRPAQVEALRLSFLTQQPTPGSTDTDTLAQ